VSDLEINLKSSMVRWSPVTNATAILVVVVVVVVVVMVVLVRAAVIMVALIPVCAVPLPLSFLIPPSLIVYQNKIANAERANKSLEDNNKILAGQLDEVKGRTTA